jgi:hypothetical protein
MFVKFSTVLAADGLHPNDCFNFHPLQLSGVLEAAWEGWRRWGSGASPTGASPLVVNPGIGRLRPDASNQSPSTTASVEAPLRGLLQVLDKGILSDNGTDDLGNNTFLNSAQHLLTELHNAIAEGRFWHHLIYAYLVENTGIERICRRLLQLALHGESLGAISEAGHRWLRTTEDLYYRDGNSSLIPSITSWLRPDPRATRRNAYHRMFGMDLNHAGDDNRPFVYEKAETANLDFIVTFEDFLREVWAAYTNATNTSGPKTTDKAAIAELSARMSQMLNDRRQHGNLTREEYASVCAMSWFHLTVYGYGSSNAPIVVDLKAEASSPEERLRKLGERVGVPAHGKARSLFKLAELVSTLFIEIEQGRYSDAASVDVLFDPKVGPATSSDMLTIINHWSMATGRNLKASVVNVTGR